MPAATKVKSRTKEEMLLLPRAVVCALLGCFLLAVRGASGQPTQEGNGKAIVVGAGTAGLVAAYELEQKGYHVTILEARDRLGGRCHTINAFASSDGSEEGVPFDDGAAWLFGIAPINETNPLYSVALDEDWPLVLTNGPSLLQKVHVGPSSSEPSSTGRNSFVPASAIALAREVASAVDPYLEANTDATIGAFLADHFDALDTSPAQEDLEWLDFFYQSFGGTSAGSDFQDLSLLFYGWLLRDMPGIMAFHIIRPTPEVPLESIAVPYYYVSDGFGQRAINYLSGRLTNQTEILLSEAVTDIRLSNSNDSAMEIDVVVAGGTAYTASYVVCTVTLGNLQSNDIFFAPDLPDSYTAAIKEMGWGQFDKIVTKFSTDTASSARINNVMTFRLRDDSTMPPHIIDHSLNASYVTGVDEFEDIYVGFAGGESRSNFFYNLSDVEAGNLLHQQLQSLIPETFTNVSSETLTTRWRDDPYARGAYSFPKPGFWEAIHIVREPVDTFGGRLLFAGEHLSVTMQSSVHGAYQSAEYAVENVPAYAQDPEIQMDEKAYVQEMESQMDETNSSAGTRATCAYLCAAVSSPLVMLMVLLLM